MCTRYAWSKSLAQYHPLVALYQHVDDISNLVVASTAGRLVTAATEYAKDFARMVAALQLTISDKSTAVPNGTEARTFTQKVTSIRIPMKVEELGVDIGVDTSSAAKRTTRKQSQRIAKSKRRARKAGLARSQEPQGTQTCHDWCETRPGLRTHRRGDGSEQYRSLQTEYR